MPQLYKSVDFEQPTTMGLLLYSKDCREGQLIALGLLPMGLS
jgi:hypothetical protein